MSRLIVLPKLTKHLSMKTNLNSLNVYSQSKLFADNALTMNQVQCYSSQKKGFLGDFIENLKEEFNRNKEMKDSVKKFREEAKRLEETDALKDARKKYKVLGDETEKSSKVFKEKLESFTESFKESEFSKKAAEITGEMAKQAKHAAETVTKQTQELSQTAAYKIVKENVKSASKTIDDVTQITNVKPYMKPEKLRKRSELDENATNKVYDSNTEATGMVLHKDSKWFQGWQNFKENNQYVNKLFEFKTQFDESDNPIVRVTRGLTERVGYLFGGIFSSTEMSAVLTEITNVEPNFNVNDFLKRVQYVIIPNVMESIRAGEMEILQDWCTEVAFNILTHPMKQCEHLKFNYNSEVLDISHLDIVATKIMEQGPVLIVRFTAQQIIYITDAKGTIVEGDKDKIKRVDHVWALCRDPTIIDPNAAWRVMEVAMHQSEMFV